MNSRWPLFALALLLLSPTACIFGVETEFDSPDDIDPGDDSYSVTIDGPDEIVVDPEDFQITYDIDCEPDGCADDLVCRISGDYGDNTFAPCGSTFELTDADVGEGEITIDVELRDGDEMVADDTTDTTVYFELDVQIPTVDPLGTNKFSHPYLGEFTIDCSHPDCQLESCQWTSASDEIQPDTQPDCSLEEPFELRRHEDLPADAELELAVYSPRFPDSRQTKETYRFEYEPPSWQTVDAGSGFGCALHTDQTLWCWGTNSYGQAGPGPDTMTEPQRIEVQPTFEDVATAQHFTCAIGADDRALYCWGRNIDQSLDPTAPEDVVITPGVVNDDHSWQQVATHVEHACGVTDDGQLYCWGDDSYEKLGGSPGNTPLVEVPVPDGFDGWSTVSTGHYHTCAVARDGDQRSTFCWGRHNRGRLGTGSTAEDQATPTEILLLDYDDYDTVSLTVGYDHSCAAFTDATDGALPTAYCWGRGGLGRLGIDTDGDEQIPQPVTDGQGLTDITAGNRHSCAIDHTSGQPYCWGSREDGRLGEGSDDSSFDYIPQPVDTEVGFASLSAHLNHTCGITDGGQLYCWGDNSLNQQPTGDDTPNLTPAPLVWPYEHLAAD